MSLTVNEIKELSVAKSFQLIAGASGLNRPVDHVNLLDFEYDAMLPDANSSDGIFDPKSIVVTSMLFAKDNPQKILPVIKQLYVDGVSTLAVKSVYFKELPDEVVNFANENSFPIFLFDSIANYSENVVVELTQAIKDHNNINVLEDKLTLILQDDLDHITRYKLMGELFADFTIPYQCMYFMPKDSDSTYSFHRQILSFRNLRDRNLIVLPYQFGILVTIFDSLQQSVLDILNYLQLSPTGYYCGISKISNKKDEFNYRVKESFYAYQYGQNHNQNVCHFDEMGIWQFILPNKNNYWMQSYCSSIVNKLKEYDVEGNCELYNTMVSYVKNSCDIIETAKQMHVHKNTIRYRVNKAKEILSSEVSLGEFNQSIFLAIYFHEILL